MLSDCNIDGGENDDSTKGIVKIILYLPIKDTPWPNYLGQPVMKSGCRDELD